MSLRVSMSRPLGPACSGDMYSGVPTIWAKPVTSDLSVRSSPSALATPNGDNLPYVENAAAPSQWYGPNPDVPRHHFGLAITYGGRDWLQAPIGGSGWIAVAVGAAYLIFYFVEGRTASVPKLEEPASGGDQRP